MPQAKKQKKSSTGAKRGPKVKLDDLDTRRILLDAIRKGMPISYASDIAGIDRQTVYNRRDADEKFSAELRLAKAEAIRGLISLTAKQSGAWRLLKNLASDEFKEHIEVEQKATMTLVVDTGDGEEEFGI